MPLQLRRDVSLAPFNTFGIAARARTFVEIRDEADLVELISLPEWRDGPRLVIGGGSNLLFVDEDRKSTRLNSSHTVLSRMPSSA